MSLQQGPLDLDLLKGSAIIVTGAANFGIGYGILESFASRDPSATLVVMDLEQKQVDLAVAELQKTFKQTKCYGFACDVTNIDAMVKIAGDVKASIGCRIGGVFANAGVAIESTSVLSMSPEGLKKMLDVNIVGVLNTAKAFCPLLKKQATASVFCTTASVGGLIRSLPGPLAGYCASKHAVVALTETLSFELAQKYPQVRVHCCCPCLVQSKLLHRENDEMQSDLLMTPFNHGVQVWDRISAGEFYMVCENVRPYVDHDYPFNALEAIVSRIAPLLKPSFKKTIDNSGAFETIPKFNDNPLVKAIMTERMSKM